MFERYTEKSRRAIFCARFEASQFGRDRIEADFILLGIAREDPQLCLQWLGATYSELHLEIARLYTTGKRIATSVDIPLSDDCKLTLAFATEEADRLGQKDVGAEHLFLGLLREGGTAAKLLKENGKDLQEFREAMAGSPGSMEMKSPPSRTGLGLAIIIVTEHGGRVGEMTWQGRMPRIGEAIRVPDLDGNESTYRVFDLCWRMNGPEGFALLPMDVLLKVRKEQD